MNEFIENMEVVKQISEEIPNELFSKFEIYQERLNEAKEQGLEDTIKYYESKIENLEEKSKSDSSTSLRKSSRRDLSSMSIASSLNGACASSLSSSAPTL